MAGSVCIVIPFVDSSAVKASASIRSVLNELREDDELVILNCSSFSDAWVREKFWIDDSSKAAVLPGIEDRSKIFGRILETWFSSDCQYVGWLSPFNQMEPGRLARQTALLDLKGLSAVYGDTTVYGELGRSSHLLEARDFSPSMIGISSFSTETMLVDKMKFMEAGGFDHVLAACYKPKIYLVTMAALAGRIERLPGPAVRDFASHYPSFEDTDILPSPKSISDELKPSDSRSLWTRIRFETFVIRAKKFAENGWKPVNVR